MPGKAGIQLTLSRFRLPRERRFDCISIPPCCILRAARARSSGYDPVPPAFPQSVIVIRLGLPGDDRIPPDRRPIAGAQARRLLRAVARRADALAQHLRRHHRAALDPREPRRHAVGNQPHRGRLCRGLCGVSRHRRPARRPVRPATDVLDRNGRLHAGLAALRRGADQHLAGRRPKSCKASPRR